MSVVSLTRNDLSDPSFSHTSLAKPRTVVLTETNPLSVRTLYTRPLHRLD